MSEPSPQRLIRSLGLREGIAIQMGMIIGSGIFIVPATVAGHLGSLGPMLLVWALGGVMVLFGALTLAELSSVLPETGGPYVYLDKSFGRVWGFLFSWNHFFINTAGSVAALAVAFATYLGFWAPGMSPWQIRIIAVAAIVLVTAINVRGVRLGGWVMDVFTAAKLIALGALIVAAFFSGKGSAANLQPMWPDHWTHSLTTGLGLSMISVLWAYDGWTTVTLTAGEMKSPRRNVPLSLVLGTIAVIVIYLAANLAYAYVLPRPRMAASSRVAADAGFQENQGNHLLDDGAVLTGKVGEPILGREAKLKALEDAVARFGIGFDDAIAIGDGANDLDMIRRAGLGVAYHAKPVVAAAAGCSISHGDLTGVLYLQGYRAEEFVSP